MLRTVVVLAFFAASARADTPTGAVDAELVTEIDLAPGHVAHPISLAPDVWWGALPRWTIGLVHSGPSVDRFVPGASLCLASSDVLACDHVYRGGGLDARYQALPWLAPRVRVLLRDIDPLKPAVALGALVQARRGRLAIAFDPYLQLGLANTDRGNDHAVVLPVRGSVDLGATRAWLDTGWNAPVSAWRDGSPVPIGVGVQQALAPQLAVGTELAFPTLLGPQNTPKERVLFLFVTTRWQP